MQPTTEEPHFLGEFSRYSPSTIGAPSHSKALHDVTPLPQFPPLILLEISKCFMTQNTRSSVTS